MDQCHEKVQSQNDHIPIYYSSIMRIQGKETSNKIYTLVVEFFRDFSSALLDE